MRGRISRKAKRLMRLKRLMSIGWLKFVTLLLTDPELDYLDYYVGSKHLLNVKVPLPHYTIGAIRWLQEQVRGIDVIIEWGAGNSTIWYSQFGCRLWAIEHDKHWKELLCRLTEEKKITNITIIEALDKHSYVSPPHVPFEKADLIVIDGLHRNECALQVTEFVMQGRLKAGCLVLFDDAQREQYKAGTEGLKKIARDWWAFTGPTWVDLDHLTLIFQV